MPLPWTDPFKALDLTSSFTGTAAENELEQKKIGYGQP